MRPAALLPTVAAALTLAALPAPGQTGEGVGGLASGFQQPIPGLDHVLAMAAVGLWGAILGAPALWMLPVAFPVAMAYAGALGVMGVPLPFVEQGIALSSRGVWCGSRGARRWPWRWPSSRCSQCTTAMPTGPNCPDPRTR